MPWRGLCTPFPPSSLASVVLTCMLDSTAGHEVVGVVRAVGAEVRAGPRAGCATAAAAAPPACAARRTCVSLATQVRAYVREVH